LNPILQHGIGGMSSAQFSNSPLINYNNRKLLFKIALYPHPTTIQLEWCFLWQDSFWYYLEETLAIWLPSLLQFSTLISNFKFSIKYKYFRFLFRIISVQLKSGSTSMKRKTKVVLSMQTNPLLMHGWSVLVWDFIRKDSIRDLNLSESLAKAISLQFMKFSVFLTRKNSQ